MKKTSFLLFFITAFLAFSAMPPAEIAPSASRPTPLQPVGPAYKLRTVIIDAGHGGKDPGCHGTTTKEAKIALKVALEVGATIKKYFPDVKVYYTRTTDVFVPLGDRADLANRKKADLFISIHCNANPTGTLYGTETYVMGLHTSEGNLEVAKRENSVILQEKDHRQRYGDFDLNSPAAHVLYANYQSAYLDNSLRLAQHIEKQFGERVGRKSRGVKQAGFLVLWKTAMPSVLVEIGFLTNKKEEKYLNNATHQSYIASAIYRAFRDYKKELEAME